MTNKSRSLTEKMSPNDAIPIAPKIARIIFCLVSIEITLHINQLLGLDFLSPISIILLNL